LIVLDQVRMSEKKKKDDGDKKNNVTEEFVKSVGNKIRRRELAAQLKKQKKKDKRKRQDERKKVAEALGPDAAPPKLIPKTLDNQREHDETTVVNKIKDAAGKEVGEEQIDEEVAWDIDNDELKDYFSKSYEPKVLITSADNPHSKTIAFIKELTRIIPNSAPFWRKNSSVKKMVKQAIKNDYTDVIVINEDNRVPNGLLLSHLPEGPTAHFKLSNVKIAREIRKDFRAITEHRPEVILNNFTTRLGHTVARMLACLFHYDPEFRGKRAVTFHNQRDFIFFRHHRYEFKSEEKCRLRELGPRFTLKLRSLQKGTFDSIHGEYEWIISGKRHDMETSRRKFFL